MPRGKAVKSMELIAAARRILSEIQPASVRAVCYKLFNEKRISSMAKSETNRVGAQLTWAREHGLIPWEWIVDDTREIDEVSSWDNPAALLRDAASQYRLNRWSQQPYRVLLASEKSTIAGTVRPVTDQYGVGFLSLHGYSSATSVHDVAKMSAQYDRIWIILYIGDHDPSGMHMSEVDLPGRLARYGGQAIIRRIALTLEDGIDLMPFSFSADDKRKDPRHGWYVEQQVHRLCWELDALDPNVLRARVEGAIRKYIDWPAWKRCEKVEEAERASLLEVVGAWNGAAS
jgi:hypothetical protein